jgi:hypothetical protein
MEDQHIQLQQDYLVARAKLIYAEKNLIVRIKSATSSDKVLNGTSRFLVYEQQPMVCRKLRLINN